MSHFPTFTVALTGGIASGKTTVANEFARLGVPIIDTDELARAVVEPGQTALTELVTLFGPGILDANGHLERRRMRERVFNDAAARRALEGILHPAIRAEQLARAAKLGGRYQLHVVPLLTEIGSQSLYDRVLVVDCPREIQLERLIRRDGVNAQLAERMLAAQATREQRLAIADDVIDNGEDVATLPARVQSLHQRYIQLAGSSTETT